MYPSIPTDDYYQKDPSLSYATPSAPPCPSSDFSGVTTGIPADHTMQAAPQPNFLRPEPWSTGLCDCFNDITGCCLTWWCPCVTFGRIAEIVDRGSTSCGVSGTLYTLIMCLTGCSCLYSCFYRSKMRGQYMLEESPCPDCCVHCCCEQCALCQEYRELQNQGFNMSIGWHGNIERQKRLAGLPPVVEGAMIR